MIAVVSVTVAVSPAAAKTIKANRACGQIAIGAGRHRVENDRSDPPPGIVKPVRRATMIVLPRVGAGLQWDTTTPPVPYAVPAPFFPAWASLRPYFDAVAGKPQRLGQSSSALLLLRVRDAVRVGVHARHCVEVRAFRGAEHLANEPCQRASLLAKGSHWPDRRRQPCNWSRCAV